MGSGSLRFAFLDGTGRSRIAPTIPLIQYRCCYSAKQLSRPLFDLVCIANVFLKSFDSIQLEVTLMRRSLIHHPAKWFEGKCTKQGRHFRKVKKKKKATIFIFHHRNARSLISDCSLNEVHHEKTCVFNEKYKFSSTEQLCALLNSKRMTMFLMKKRAVRSNQIPHIKLHYEFRKQQ